MKKIISMLTIVLISILTVQSYADIKIIPSKISGEAYQIGNTITIINPAYYLGGDLIEQTKKLYATYQTAVSACNILGYSYVSFKSDEGFDFIERVIIEEDGELSFLKSEEFISFLACKAKP
jgi:hypothetical protein